MDAREILQKVADGELSPEQASELLDRPTETASTSEPLFPETDVQALRLTGALRSATIVADPDVRTVTVEGDHKARIEDSTIVIDDDDEATEGFRFESRGSREHRTRRGRGIRIGVEHPRPVPLVVRANPALVVEAQIAAGTLKIRGMRAAITAEVSAGALSVEDATGPLNLTTAAGPIKVRGRIDRGEHRIRCEAGAVKVVLEPGSDVAITARASLGKVSLPGGNKPAGFAIGSAAAERTIGNGVATLTIDCSVGGVKVVMAEDEPDHGPDAA